MQIWNLISERLFTHAVPVNYNNKTYTLISTKCYMLLNLSKLLKLFRVYQNYLILLMHYSVIF